MRGKLEIMAEMLHAAKTPTAKTRIMYKCCLNHAQLKRYLQRLLEADLLKCGSKWQTTEKGFRFLKIYGQLDAIVG